ncbi:MAG: GNAT family N-acetyltransferase [Acetanaerobacterium sp.]
MTFIMRPENEGDYAEVEGLTREAFWDIYHPGCDEHLLVHKLRKTSSYIPELDFVAVQDNRIVGNIIYSRAKIVDSEDIAHEVITFGPISVLPSLQKKGIGSALIEHTKKLAENMGFKAIILFGNPGYYHRFCFKSAGKFGISTADGSNFEEFMAMELYAGALQGIAGRFYEDAVFHVDKKELEVFEKKFPYKEKHVTDTQLK